MVARTKREHCVAVSYLKRFTNKKGLLQVYDCASKKHFSANPKNVACESNFYEPPTPLQKISNVPVNSLESVWSNIENASKILFDKLLLDIEQKINSGSNILSLSNNDRLAISMITTFQILRTRRTRDFITASYKSTNTSESISDSAEFILHHNWLKEGFAQIITPIYNLTWAFGLARNYELITSDNPVVNRIAPTGPRIGWLGLNTKRARLAYPISPTLVILMYGASVPELHSIRKDEILTLPDAEVSDLNITQLLQCQRQIFSKESLKDCIYLRGFSRFA